MRIISKQKFQFERYSEDGLTVLESAKTGENGVVCSVPNWVAGCSLFQVAVKANLIMQLDAVPDIEIKTEPDKKESTKKEPALKK